MAGIKANKVDDDRHADFRIAQSNTMPGWLRVVAITDRAREWCNEHITNNGPVPCEPDGSMLFNSGNQQKLGIAILDDGFDVGEI